MSDSLNADDDDIQVIPRVKWHDLRRLTPRQTAVEWTLSLPWLTASLILYHHGMAAPGLFCSFYFFLTGLRQAHGAQHYTLGRSKLSQDLLLLVLSFLMVASLHALQATHWHHHRHSMDEDDVESSTARMPWWGAILSGPRFILALHREGIRLAQPRQLRWIGIELATLTVWLGVLAIAPTTALAWHFGAMLLGECLTGFFAVWTVHHDCDGVPAARTQRGRLWNWLSYGMFYHVEHHLYPAVPTPNLPRLAKRLDGALHDQNLPQVIE